jgi:hypothetical protein
MESLMDQKEAYPVAIEGANVIEHLAQKQHERHVVNFLRINGVKQHQKASFILSEDSVQHYKKRFNSFWAHHQGKQEENNDPTTICTPEKIESSVSSSNDETPQLPKMPERPQPSSSGEAYLEYMIARSKTLKEMRKQQLLLPGRVGATVHHLNQPSSHCVNQDWLPNYGSVWNPGPRKKTQEAFHHTKEESAGRFKSLS